MSRLGAMLGFAWVASPKAMGGACLVLLNVHLISRMSREDYAVYSLCLTMLALLADGLFGAAMDMAVLKLSPLHLQDLPDTSLAIERTALRFKLAVVGSLSLLLLVGSVPLGEFLFHQAGYSYLIVIVALAACCSVALASFLVHLQIRGLFFQYGLLDWLQMATRYAGIACVLLIYFPNSVPVPPAGILLWFAAAPAIAIVGFGFWIGTSLFRPPIDGAQWRVTLIHQGKWMLATLVVSTLIAKLDVFMLTWLSSIDEVALYFGGQTLASIPIMLGTYLAIVLNPKVMPYCKAGKFFPLLRDVQLSLVLFGIAAYSLVYLFREPITTHVLPADFARSRDVFLVLLPMTLAGMISYPLTIAFLMYVRPHMLLQMECLILLPTVIGYAIAIPHYGAIGAAVVSATAGIVKTIIAQCAAFYWSHKSLQELGLANG